MPLQLSYNASAGLMIWSWCFNFEEQRIHNSCSGQYYPQYQCYNCQGFILLNWNFFSTASHIYWYYWEGAQWLCHNGICLKLLVFCPISTTCYIHCETISSSHPELWRILVLHLVKPVSKTVTNVSVCCTNCMPAYVRPSPFTRSFNAGKLSGKFNMYTLAAFPI